MYRNLSDISPPLTNQYTITLFQCCEKVEYRADWSERTNLLTITLFSPVCGEKSEILYRLVRVEHANCGLGINELTRTGFRSLYFSPIFYNVPHMTSRTTGRQCSWKMSQPLLSWIVSQPPPSAQKNSQPAPVLNFNCVFYRS